MSERNRHLQQPLPTLLFTSMEVDEIRRGAYRAVENRTYLLSVPFWSAVGAGFILVLNGFPAQEMSVRVRKHPNSGEITGAELFFKNHPIFPFMRGREPDLDHSWEDDPKASGTFRAHLDTFEKHLIRERRIFPRCFARLRLKPRCNRRDAQTPLDFLVALSEAS